MSDVNEYFDGNVKSIAFTNTGLPSTVGVMKAGSYTFGTSQKEYMTVISGQLDVKLPGTDTFKRFDDGETFVVDANSSFDVKVPVDTAYLCRYE